MLVRTQISEYDDDMTQPSNKERFDCIDARLGDLGSQASRIESGLGFITLSAKSICKPIWMSTRSATIAATKNGPCSFRFWNRFGSGRSNCPLQQ